MPQQPPRIVFYGIGQYGLEAARIALAKGWPIVAALNRTGGKVGQDLARLAGLDRNMGVIVQDCDLVDYSRLDADIAFVCTNSDRLKDNLPVYERLMSAGLNVICHGAESYFPQVTDPESAARIDAMARRNGVSFTGTGIWDFSRIWPGLLVVGPSSEIRSLFHRGLTDVQGASLAMMRMCGVSLTMEEFAAQNTGAIGGIYRIPAQLVLHGLGYDIASVTEHREPIVSSTPVFCRLLDRDLEPGICTGVRIVSTVATRQGVKAVSHTELRILLDGESEHMFWSVDGRPVSSIRIDRTDNVHSSAACVVNRMPDVIAAPPGIRVITELGPLLPKLCERAPRFEK